MGGVVKSIAERGVLRCGITLCDNQIAVEDTQGDRVGLGIELCRALSASLLKGKTDTIFFVKIPETSDYANISLALKNGDIDVYAGREVHMNGDVQRPGSSFSKPYLYEAPHGNSTAVQAFSLATKEVMLNGPI
mmetsp:Transcript_8292/g.15525  ORF Transcript_8292/g.15525 Transcript_8292/m.15525 type:complete len:134 (-) Transcript_8292:331-732(-)